ncbi:GNAT family N-acetyltransferase [Chelatococcus albus]|uniref:GNAT family N-acetyltransferase n=1 Tax=Chelatococcus albus TaxID=3047466 RepID=UPI003BEF23D4
MDAIARAVHLAHPERPEVFAERLALLPAGCHVLEEAGGALAGYVLSHPWRDRAPPALDSLIGGLPVPPATFYLHDLAILPEARGGGAGGRIVARLAEIAAGLGLPTLSLVAVNASVPFWQRQGFAVAEEPALAAKLASYGADARFMTRALVA